MYWRHGLKTLRAHGPAALARLILGKLRRATGGYQPGRYDFGYRQWLAAHPETPGTGDPEPGTLVSVLMPVYNVDRDFLVEAAGSVIGQTWPHWQLCIVNDASTADHIRPCLDDLAAQDARIEVVHLDSNRGIAGASQRALEMARGEWIALLDHDDVLAPHALREMLLVARSADADFVYSDEDKLEEGQRTEPFFKPDWSPELLRCQNYLAHLLLIRRELVLACGGFRPGFDGAQDYDLVLRTAFNARRVAHVPMVLYHWRKIAGSTSREFSDKDYAWEAGRKALQAALDLSHPGATAELGDLPGTYRPGYPVTGNPRVSIILPFRDRADLLDRCLETLFGHAGWRNLEVVGVNNGSAEAETLATMARWQAQHPSVRFIDYPGAFNYSAICNAGVAASGGDYIVLLNNDIEIRSHHWIPRLLAYAQQGGIGAVGGMLSYPDGRLQHAGIVIGIGGSAGHAFRFFPAGHPGYYGRLRLTSNVSAVTGALLMVAKDRYLEVGGLDETDFAVAMNDVDFCLRLREAGYRNVVTADVSAVHHESVSRGADNGGANQDRFSAEVAALGRRWPGYFEQGDPCYNPNLTLASEDYRLRQHPD